MKRGLLFGAFAAASLLPAFAQQDAAPAVNRFIGNTQAVTDGQAVYDRVCTACHGGAGSAGEMAPAIVLASATTLRGQLSDAQLLAIIRNGVPGSQMPAWAGKLSDDDILKVEAYIHALRGVALDNPMPGDAAAGEQVFWGKGGCGTCHMISGRGGVIGPDLTNIAAIRKAAAISDALTKAQHRVYGDGGVAPSTLPTMDYNPVTLATRGGQTIDGVMLNQDAWSVQMMGMDGKLHLLDRADIASITIKPGSVMPSDYDKRLAPDEFRDLLAFLTRQGKLPATPRPRAAAD